MSELRINNITDRAGSSGPIIAGVSTVTSTSHMVMPSGPTEMRNSPSEVDLSGSQKILSSGGRGRGIFAGQDPSADSIDKIDIATNGNATDFGDLTTVRSYAGGMSNSTRGVFAGGYTPTQLNSIDFVNIQTTGDATDYGDLSLGANFVLQATSDSHGGL